MELKNILSVISGGMGIQIFADLKSIFCGCMCESPKEEFDKCVEKYLERKVYRINYDNKKKLLRYRYSF